MSTLHTRNILGHFFPGSFDSWSDKQNMPMASLCKASSHVFVCSQYVFGVVKNICSVGAVLLS